MASYSWALGKTGNWNTAANWTPATAPNDAAADVTIDAAPSVGAYIVTIGTNETETVRTLTMNGATNLAGSIASPYNAAELELDGTLFFENPGNVYSIDGSLQSWIHSTSPNAKMVNAGTVDGFIQVEGNMLITGTNGFYVTNWLQALAGTVTVDTTSIAELSGNTLFDGIYEAKGPNAQIFLGGSLQHAIINIATIEGPPLNLDGWTELLMNGTSTAIQEWTGAGYVSIETTLQELRTGGTLDVLGGRNYTSTNKLTVDNLGVSKSSGELNLGGGIFTAPELDINGGVVQGFGTIVGGVVNNGTMSAVGGTLNLTGSLTGTGTVRYDFDNQTGTINPAGHATLVVNAVTTGQTIVMNGSDVLQLNTPSSFAGTIQANVGDQIILNGIAATSATYNAGKLTVLNGSNAVALINVSSNLANDSFTTSGSIITIGTGGVTPPSPTSHFTITDTTNNVTITDPGTTYAGPVVGLNWQYATVSTDNLAITTTSPNAFIHTGSGNDAIDVSHVNGTNVLDGGTGSNFLVGGTGNDTFFLDSRNATADIWSTVVNFHSGDNATIWGITPSDFTLNKYDNQGAVGYQGLDFSFSAAGRPNLNLTLAGFTSADLTNGKLTVTYGTTAATADLPAATYMLVHAN